MTLVPPVFLTGPDDKLAAVDIYKKLDGTIAGLNLDNLDLLQSDLAKSLKADWANLKDLKMLIGNTVNGLMVDIEALKKGILSVSNGVMGYFNSLPQWLQDSLLKISGVNKIATTMNGLTTYLSHSDYSTVTSLAQLIKGISGCDFPVEVIDQNGRLLLSINLVKEAAGLGLPNAYTAFINCISDRYFGTHLTQSILPYITDNSDHKLLSEVANNSYAGDVSSFMPSFLNEFVSKFTLKPGTSTTDYGGILSSIFNSFGKMDSSWSTNSCMGNASQFANASKDFLSLLDVNKNSAVVDLGDPFGFSDGESLSGLLSLTNENQDSNGSNFFKPVEDFFSSTFDFLV